MILYGISGGRGLGRDGSTRLHLAARRGNINCKVAKFQLIFTFVNEISGNIKIVEDEIDDGEDVDTTDFLGNTPLHEAVLNGNSFEKMTQ